MRVEHHPAVELELAEADLIRVTAIKHEKRHPRLGGDRL
jgi:hypothetical protein